MDLNRLLHRSRRARTYRGVVAVGLAAALMVTSCGSDSESDDKASASPGSTAAPGSGEPYRIGVVTSLTGPANFLGLEEMNTYRLAAELVNADGGIDGHPIEVIEYDDESSPEIAVRVTQKLISQDKVHGIVGGLSSTATLAVKPIIEQAHVPLVSAHVAVASTADAPKYLFRSAPNDRVTTQAMLEYFTEEGFDKVALLHDSNAYGTGAKELFEDLVDDFDGVEVATTESYASADTDLRAQLTKINSSKPDAIALLGTGPGPALAVKQAAELGIKSVMVGGSGVVTAATLELAGAAAANIIAFGYGDGECPKEEQKPFVEQFKAKYKRAPQGFEFLGDGMYLMLEALRKVKADPGDVDAVREELRDGMEQIDGLYWASGPWSYGPGDHEGVGSDSLVLTSVKDGKWRRADCDK